MFGKLSWSAIPFHDPIPLFTSLIVILAIVGAMHPDEKCRADAQKVLDRLLWHGEGRTGG